jgi:hypothetical protein
MPDDRPSSSLTLRGFREAERLGHAAVLVAGMIHRGDAVELVN